MAEVLVQFQESIQGANGTVYTAQVCGRDMGRGLWEGWIEFTPEGSGTVIRTGQETTQPNRPDLYYWATGLTAAYLQGALTRASTPPHKVPDRTVSAAPAYNEPRPPRLANDADGRAHAILDPFAVYRDSGDTVLRGQLRALYIGQLRNIVKAYSLGTAGNAEVDALTKPVLVDLIVMAVEAGKPGVA